MTLSLILLSCSELGEPVASIALEPRSLWSERGSQAYVIEQNRICFCPGSDGYVRLTVVNGQIIRRVTVDGGDSLPIEELKLYKTVDELFEFIDEVEGCEPAVLQIDYDPDLGYPRKVYVDMNIEIADEELGFNTKLIQLLP
jgi:hypothetical protein